MSELLWYCEKFGEPGSAIFFLAKSGHWSQAIDAAITTPLVGVSHITNAVRNHMSDWIEILNCLRSTDSSVKLLAALEQYLRNACNYEPLYAFELAMGREMHAGITCVHLYLRANDWETRFGYLESARRHLSARRRRSAIRLDDNSDMDDDDNDDNISNADSDELDFGRRKILIPFNLPMGVSGITESTVRSIRTLVDLQLEVCKMMPICPPSASLFGSIQSVSELIDYLLMDGHVGLAKKLIAQIKLPDSALCGIFE